jgi:hypothetical protein
VSGPTAVTPQRGMDGLALVRTTSDPRESTPVPQDIRASEKDAQTDRYGRCDYPPEAGHKDSLGHAHSHLLRQESPRDFLDADIPRRYHDERTERK